jgi:hypothetical protein
MSLKKNTRIKIFFCPSWIQIEEIINLTTESKKKFIFVVENEDLYFFFKKFYLNSKIIFLKSPRTIFTANPIKLINNFYLNYLEKKKIKFIFNKYSHTKVYCSDSFNLVQMAYAAKVLSLRNQLFLYSNKINIEKFLKKKIGLKMFLYNIYIKMFYRISCYSVADPNHKLYSVYSDKYYKFINAKKIKNPVNILLLKKFIKKKLNLHNKIKILLLSSFEAIADNLLDEGKFKIWANEFVKIADPKKIIFKRKSINEKKYFTEKLFSEAPSYLPASLLCYKVDIIVGYNSSTLFQAANAGCKAISLLDLLKKEELNPNLNYYKKFLTDNLISSKKILFPKNMSEFNKLIKT